VRVAVQVLGRDAEDEGDARRGRGRGADGQVHGGGATHRNRIAGGGDRAVGEVGGGDRLAAGRPQRDREDVAAQHEPRVRRHRRPGVGGRQVDGAGKVRVDVAEGVFRLDGHDHGVAGGAGRRGGDDEVRGGRGRHHDGGAGAGDRAVGRVGGGQEA